MTNLEIAIISSLFGLIFGSFFNVVALRMLSGENLSYPASHCVECNHKLNPFDLVPVLSYAFLRGKCRYCGVKINPIYPIGELLTAFSYGVIVYKYGLSSASIINIVFITFMIIATITDLKATMVPDRVTAIGFVFVLLLRLIFKADLFTYIISSALSFSLLFLIFMVSGGKMGGADVKMYALIGLAIGFGNAAISLFYASAIALLYHLPFLVTRTWTRDKEIPFIPFITLGVLLTFYINAHELILLTI